MKEAAMSADALLAMTVSDAAIVFGATEVDVMATFRTLVRLWHPDRCSDPRASDVMAKIVDLKNSVLLKLRGGMDLISSTHLVDAIGTPAKRMTFFQKHILDTGELLIGSNSIGHEVDEKYGDLISNALRISPKYADSKMKQEVSRIIARSKFDVKTKKGHFFAYERKPNQILLRDLMAHTPVFDSRHAAWLTTRLMNIVNWLSFNRIVHGDIGPDTLLVSVDDHQVGLCGPFLFATDFGSKPVAMPARTVEAVSDMKSSSFVAGPSVDLELVRATVREVLGDFGGSRLLRDSNVPSAFSRWLTMVPSGDAQSDFAAWEKTREASFGERRFIEWRLDPLDVYGNQRRV